MEELYVERGSDVTGRGKWFCHTFRDAAAAALIGARSTRPWRSSPWSTVRTPRGNRRISQNLIVDINPVQRAER